MIRSFNFQILNGELIETSFTHPIIKGAANCIRGKSSGAFLGYGTFQWTAAVQALTLLLLKCLHSHASQTLGNPVITGGQGSLAASLDYAITKNPLWISAMFGTDSRGESIIRRVILRTNSNLKRPGPVSLTINQQFMPIEGIKCLLDGKRLLEPNELQALIYKITSNSTTSRRTTQHSKYCESETHQ